MQSIIIIIIIIIIILERQMLTWKSEFYSAIKWAYKTQSHKPQSQLLDWILTTHPERISKKWHNVWLFQWSLNNLLCMENVQSHLQNL